MSSIIIVSDWGDREFSEPTDARFPLSFHQLLKYNISAFHPLSLNQSAGFYNYRKLAAEDLPCESISVTSAACCCFRDDYSSGC